MILKINGRGFRLTLRRIQTLRRCWPMPGVEFGGKNIVKRMRRIRKLADVPWAHDIVRHTFCSMACHKFGKRITAELACTSESLLETTYVNLVKNPNEVKEFWAFRPKSRNIVDRNLNTVIHQFNMSGENDNRKPVTERRLAPAILFGGWVSVKERLPKADAPVLVCEGGVVTTIARYGLERFGPPVMRWQVVANCGGYECEDDPCEPDYWMPLPKPPNASS